MLRASGILCAALVLSATCSAYFLPADRSSTSWDDAQARCEAEGSHLATMYSVDDVFEVYQLLFSAALPARHGWIGLRSSAPNAGFDTWVDGTPLDATFWRDGEPNNLATELCAEMHTYSSINTAAIAEGKVWNNLDCSRDRPPICGKGNPVCNLPPSQWLETEFMPELDTDASGFNTGVKDEFQIVFTYHRKYFDVVPSSDGLTAGAGGELTHTVEEETPELCYDRHTVKVAWADLVTKCHRGEEGGASGFVVYTCKIEIDSKETLQEIRSTDLTRTVHNELPFIVKFPKQVSASVDNLSAFAPVNLLAAIVRQEVHVDVSAVTDVDAKISLFTSVQYPFRLKLGSETVETLPGDISQDSFANAADCPDPAAPDAPNPGVLDSNACNQLWVLDLQVDAAIRCDLDGQYQVSFEAECQPFFDAETDCPLLQDDQGQVSTTFTVDFTIDSEDFCAVVVDSVDLDASLSVWKDHTHIVAATNFIHGQTAYFVATATSNKVTIVKVTVDDIDVDITGGPAAGHYDLFTDGSIEAAGTAVSLVIENSDDPANGNPDQAWFHLLVDEATFEAAVDGSADFDLSVTLNVEFKDAQGVLLERKQRQQVALLQGGKSQPVAANVQAGFSSADDSEAAPAGTLRLGACALALAGGAAAINA